jgi:predicted DNA-binding protein YlxM (UPF0122 family)
LAIAKLKFVLLCDFYGNLLTEKQQNFLKLHYEQDLSFGEIAMRFGVTRQAVCDSIRSSEIALERYESSLGLLSDFQRQRKVLSDILTHLQCLEDGLDDREQICTIQYIRKCIYALMNSAES